MANKIVLQGTVEEQAAQLYDMAVEAMRDGRYSLAYRYLQEIERALPGFRDVPTLLAQAKAAKQEQRALGWGAIVGGIAMIGVARGLGVEGELFLLAAAAGGLLVGFFVTLVLYPRFKRS